jgi:hypothetical protein
MSLSALNSPPLIATAGAVLSYAMPSVDTMVSNTPWSVVRVANLISFGINFASVSRPGRMDGEAVEDGQLSPRNGKTLVAPAGWAFAIWGPIFLGEAIGVASQFMVKDNAPIVKILKETSGPFITAQIFQSLWCASFRPKYNGNNMFISVGMLGATAYSLSKAHAAFTSPAGRGLYSPFQYAIFFFPMALHFGWTTAASIVNLNGAVALKKDTTEKVIAWVGHVSVIAATALGMYLSSDRNAPVYGLVISWALSAVADSMKKRIDGSAEKPKKKKVNAVGLYGAPKQYFLSKTGAILNAGTASILSAILLFGNGAKSMPTL